MNTKTHPETDARNPITALRVIYDLATRDDLDDDTETLRECALTAKAALDNKSTSLIAAAPELLEALEWAESNCAIQAHNAGRVQPTVLRDILTGIVERARAAIAKTTNNQ